MKNALFTLLVLVILVAALAPAPASARGLPWECLLLFTIPGAYNHPGLLTACAYMFADAWDEWDEWGDWPYN